MGSIENNLENQAINTKQVYTMTSICQYYAIISLLCQRHLLFTKIALKYCIILSMFELISIIIDKIEVFLVGITIPILAIFGIGVQNTEELTYTPPQETQKVVEIEKPDIEQDVDKKEIVVTTQQEDDNVASQSISTIQNIISQFTPKQVDEDLNKKTRDALVNILCTTDSAGAFYPITGSGVIIDPKGVILTNAHIAQYFLLENYKYEGSMNCFIRKGAPASPAYDVEILYISPSWVKENAHQITKEKQKGTGENDFALLRINKSLTSVALPESFPYISPEPIENTAIQGTPVLIAGYPAGFLGGIAIQKNLWPVSTISNIMERYTFTVNDIDLIALGGNIAAQPGSSGGAVVSMTTRNLLGIVVTSTSADSTDDRELNAITVFHINRSILNDIGTTLSGFLSGDIKQQAQTFKETLEPTLTTLLEQELSK